MPRPTMRWKASSGASSTERRVSRTRRPNRRVQPAGASACAGDVDAGGSTDQGVSGAVWAVVDWSRGAVAGVVAAGLFTVGGCADRLPEPVALPPPSAAAEPDAALDRYYTQPVEWADCSVRQCATLDVPRDYAHPDAGSIGLALARIPARDSGRRLGSLVINPGGPGLSGVQALAGAARVVSPEVRDVFDLVGVDPAAWATRRRWTACPMPSSTPGAALATT